MEGAIDDPVPVTRKERAAVVTKLVGQLFHVLAIGIHDVNIEIAIAGGGEDDVFSIFRNDGLRVVPLLVSKGFGIGAVGIGDIDVVRRIDRPAISLAPVGWGRTLGRGGMGR